MSIKISGASEQLTESKLDRAEKSLGRPIPPAYREFLLQHNGGRPESSDFKMAAMRKGKVQMGTVKEFLAIGDPEETVNLDYVLETFHDRIPPNSFPFARDPGGNLIVLATGGTDVGKVYFWDHEYEAEEGEPPTNKNLYLIADTFDDFISKLGDV
jgi:cell wall assembly regulator SMI1